jgi:hypothetical protein
MNKIPKNGKHSSARGPFTVASNVNKYKNLKYLCEISGFHRVGLLRYSLFWGFKQRWLVVVYGRLGAAYRSHLQGQSIASIEWRIHVCDITSLRAHKSLATRDTRVANVFVLYFYLSRRFGWQKQDMTQEQIITIEREGKTKSFCPPALRDIK